MPDRDVETIQDLIYYQYSKIIARSAFAMPNGKEAKGKHYGFIKQTFRELKSGTKSWSEITREDWQFVEADKRCIYCGATMNLSKEHIVPKSLKINERCPACDRIQGIHNQVWACKDCNSLKGTKGLYEFYKTKFSQEKKFFDLIPPLLEKKYLKTIYYCHTCAETLYSGDKDISVLNIDSIIQQYV